MSVRVLVAGGAGYIGSHTARLLAQEGFEPVILDDLSTGHAWALQGPLIKGDIADARLVSSVVEDVKPVALLHFASSILVGESMELPEKYYANNVAGSIALLGVALKYGLPVIFSSSAAVYGTPEKTPITEDAPRRPDSVYGQTKLVVEEMLSWYSRLRDLRYISLRYFNAAGASGDSALGELHRPETHLIPLALHSVLGIREKLTVFGDDYDTPDGTCIRDYIHVEDLAEAHLLALRHLLDRGESEVFNLGCQKGYSNMEVIGTVESATGKTVPREVGPRRPGDPPVLLASSGKIGARLGWKPKYALGDMVEHTWKFLLANEDRVRKFYGEPG